MGFLLLIIALILILGLSIVNYFFVEDTKGYFRSTALNLDRFANREFRAFWNKILIKPFGYKFGNINESVSEVLGYNIIWNQLKKPGVFLVQLLSIKHCIEALPTEIKTMYNNQINEIMESQPKSIIEKLKTTFTTGKGW